MNDITTQALLDRYGSQAEIARALNVTPGAVWQWFRAGAVPPLQQYRLRDLWAVQADAGEANAPESSVG